MLLYLADVKLPDAFKSEENFHCFQRLEHILIFILTEEGKQIKVLFLCNTADLEHSLQSTLLQT